MLALKSHKLEVNSLGSQSQQRTRTLRQSASTLDLHYGRSLRLNIMACDTLYALRLTFCASMLNEFEDSDYHQELDCLPNLKNLKH